jgi:hypothetical protein
MIRCLGDEESVPDRLEQCHRAQDLGRGNHLVLDGGELVTQLNHALLELVVARVELGHFDVVMEPFVV